MSQQAQVLNQSAPGERGQSTFRWKIPVLVIGLAALVLLALAVLTAMPADKPAVSPQEGDSQFAINPELMVARRYAGPVQAESNFLAINPELMVARRYAGPVQAEASFLAANPELMVARRYASAVQAESSFLAANPELIVARRYTDRVQVEQAALLSVEKSR